MSEHPAQPAPPEEPKTPMWLPAVGAVLFLIVGIWWAVTPSASPAAAPGGSAVADAGTG